MNPKNAGVVADDERAHVAELLVRYPQLSDEELEAIHRWFRRVATPLDLGTLASDPRVAAHYRAYRADHHDRFAARDFVHAGIFLSVIVAVLGAIYVAMP
ncbi:hypothetical protein HT136_20280 [Novosphingobium profundi]|uniref:hypothetical protein n=1 Tax=Novosphingobium profundi TaxID=1774954 RepID=UPI001BD99F66|nr:hypothetical protein [Novosphingobium profundi]MBT0670709.1 hypothetical protein [Novosphingobium profundi]